MITDNLENNCSFKTGDMYIMGRYLIFMFGKWYPRGGANDFIGSANNKEEIRDIIINHYNCKIDLDYNELGMINIIDTKNCEIIALRVYDEDDCLTEEDDEYHYFYDEKILDDDKKLNINKIDELLSKIKE